MLCSLIKDVHCFPAGGWGCSSISLHPVDGNIDESDRHVQVGTPTITSFLSLHVCAVRAFLW